ncbi:hypothetical protein [Flavobacterium sp. ACN6]|uniref:hypothetical protein n=1 Tax=Flavobacterium sp. ACN6 TaxID=1920426 RepID=UPI000BB32225|nr:hypothetical protein [Flavobacterium sp. ACN6]PBJ08245.1 hypothetical protein BSF42_35980 [Flavobacterium sp. ACN6]
MENLNFIDPLLHGITPESQSPNISVKQMLCAGVGALLASAVLKKTGHTKASAVVGSIALPIIVSACYKKFNQVSKDKIDAKSSSGIEYNH